MLLRCLIWYAEIIKDAKICDEESLFDYLVLKKCLKKLKSKLYCPCSTFTYAQLDSQLTPKCPPINREGLTFLVSTFALILKCIWKCVWKSEFCVSGPAIPAQGCYIVKKWTHQHWFWKRERGFWWWCRGGCFRIWGSHFWKFSLTVTMKKRMRLNIS